MNNVMGNKFGQLLVDVYMLALSTALDLHIKICQEVHGHVSVVTTKPLTQSTKKKFAMLLWEDDTYKMILRKGIQQTKINLMDITMDHPYIQNPENITTPCQLPKTSEINEKSQETKPKWNDEVLKKFKEIYKSSTEQKQKLTNEEIWNKFEKTYNFTTKKTNKGNGKGKSTCLSPRSRPSHSEAAALPCSQHICTLNINPCFCTFPTSLVPGSTDYNKG